jgi:putative ABC transport system substrate-binding protein
MGRQLRRLAQVLAVSTIVLTELLPAFSDAPLVISVVLSRDVAPYRQALKGFEEVLRSSGRPYKIHEYTTEGSSIDAEALVEKVRARRPAMILTIGSSATETIAQRVKDIPVVFSLVLPSSGGGVLEEIRNSHDNITGSSMEIPIRTQFAKIRQVLPTARRMGVLYDPEVTGTVVDNASRVAAGMGLELVMLPVGSEKDLLAVTSDLSSRMDVLWSVADSTVFSPSGLRQVLLATLRGRVPFVGLSPSFVKAGALLALSVDYQDVGRQSGEQALRILAGEEPSQIPVTTPRSLSLSLNLNTAKQIQVTIQDEIRAQAEVFF